jgi:serine/threonine protein kinase
MLRALQHFVVCERPAPAALPLPLSLLQYIVVDTLGRGSFGKVKLCLHTGDDTLYAVKVVNTRAVSCGDDWLVEWMAAEWWPCGTAC